MVYLFTDMIIVEFFFFFLFICQCKILFCLMGNKQIKVLHKLYLALFPGHLEISSTTCERTKN